MKYFILIALSVILTACDSPDYSLSKKIPSKIIMFSSGISIQLYTFYSYEIRKAGITISDQDLRHTFNIQDKKPKASKNYSPGILSLTRQPIRISIHLSKKRFTGNCSRVKIINKLRYCYQVTWNSDYIGSGGQEYYIKGWAKLPKNNTIIFSASKQAEDARPYRVFDSVWTILTTLRY